MRINCEEIGRIAKNDYAYTGLSITVSDIVTSTSLKEVLE